MIPENERSPQLKNYYAHKEERQQKNKEWRNRPTVKPRRAKYIKERRERNYLKWYNALKELGMTTCRKCGYDKCFAAIDFHHPDPSKKENNNKRGVVMSSRVFKEETLQRIKDLIPLCKNCHTELHHEEEEG